MQARWSVVESPFGSVRSHPALSTLSDAPQTVADQSMEVAALPLPHLSSEGCTAALFSDVPATLQASV